MKIFLNEEELITAVENYLSEMVTPKENTKTIVKLSGGGRASSYTAEVEIYEQYKEHIDKDSGEIVRTPAPEPAKDIMLCSGSEDNSDKVVEETPKVTRTKLFDSFKA